MFALVELTVSIPLPEDRGMLTVSPADSGGDPSIPWLEPWGVSTGYMLLRKPGECITLAQRQTRYRGSDERRARLAGAARLHHSYPKLNSADLASRHDIRPDA